MSEEQDLTIVFTRPHRNAFLKETQCSVQYSYEEIYNHSNIQFPFPAVIKTETGANLIAEVIWNLKSNVNNNIIHIQNFVIK